MLVSGAPSAMRLSIYPSMAVNIASSSASFGSISTMTSPLPVFCGLYFCSTSEYAIFSCSAISGLYSVTAWYSMSAAISKKRLLNSTTLPCER